MIHLFNAVILALSFVVSFTGFLMAVFFDWTTGQPVMRIGAAMMLIAVAGSVIAIVVDRSRGNAIDDDQP